MNKKQLALIAGVAIGIAGGPGLAPASVIIDEDFADISEWGAFGGSVAALDTETDGRTALADGDTSNFVEIQQGFTPLALGSNPGLASFTVDTVLRQNDPVAFPPKTVFLDFRNDGNAVTEFQRLTSQYNSQTAAFQVAEYVGTDTLLTTHFSGTLSPALPQTDAASDYSTFRFVYDYNTLQFTVSSIIGGTETPITTFALTNPVGAEFDRLRYRFEGETSGTFPGDSNYFIDHASINTVIPEPGTLGLLGVATLTLLGLRRRRS